MNFNDIYNICAAEVLSKTGKYVQKLLLTCILYFHVTSHSENNDKTSQKIFFHMAVAGISNIVLTLFKFIKL